MKTILEEYGLLLALIGCLFIFIFYRVVKTDFKDYSRRFIGSITGNYMSYDVDITLTEIEETM